MKLTYQMCAKLLSWLVLHGRSNTADEIEILVLRHQLAVLQRRTPRPRISWTDRAVIRRELLDRILIINQRHAAALLQVFERHYNDHRPHRTLRQAAPSRPIPHRAPTDIRKIQRHDRVGGLFHEYQQVA